jgi:hypothetical protein
LTCGFTDRHVQLGIGPALAAPTISAACAAPARAKVAATARTEREIIFMVLLLG